MIPQDSRISIDTGLPFPSSASFFLTLATGTYRWCWWMQRSQWTYHDVIVSSDKNKPINPCTACLPTLPYIHHCSLYNVFIFPKCKQRGTVHACTYETKDVSGKQSEEKWSESAKSCLKDWFPRRLRLLEILLQEQPEAWCEKHGS